MSATPAPKPVAMPSVSSQPRRLRGLQGGRDAGRHVVPGRGEQETRFGAELTRAEGEGADEAGGDLLGPARAAAVVITTGFTVPISAYTGMTTSRWLASRQSASPPGWDPVNATAAISGARTSASARVEAGDQPEGPVRGARGRRARRRRPPRAARWSRDGPGGPSRPPGIRRRAPSRCRCPGPRTRTGSCSRRAPRPGRGAPASGAGRGPWPCGGRRPPAGTTPPPATSP